MYIRIYAYKYAYIYIYIYATLTVNKYTPSNFFIKIIFLLNQSYQDFSILLTKKEIPYIYI